MLTIKAKYIVNKSYLHNLFRKPLSIKISNHFRTKQSKCDDVYNNVYTNINIIQIKTRPSW